MEAVLGLFGALVGAFVTWWNAQNAHKEQRRKEILDLVSFIDTVSELLYGMHENLAKNIVPTNEGNRLKQVLNDYETVITSSRIDSKIREELKGILPQIKSLLTTAEFEDEIIRGVVLTYDSKSRKRLLHELLRTASRLKGMSDTLKAIAGHG